MAAQHKVSISRRSPDGDDQRQVRCSCGWRSSALYAYEARMEKAHHLISVGQPPPMSEALRCTMVYLNRAAAYQAVALGLAPGADSPEAMAVSRIERLAGEEGVVWRIFTSDPSTPSKEIR